MVLLHRRGIITSHLGSAASQHVAGPYVTGMMPYMRQYRFHAKLSI